MAKRTIRTIEAQPADPSVPLLAVKDVRTHFKTAAGSVKAVDGVSFELHRGRTLGIVGESGSGKSVLSRTLMGLLPARNAEKSGSVRFEGEELIGRDEATLRKLWGIDMAMVFQDPMTSLNPVTKVGAQITESLRLHLDMNRSEAKEAALSLLEQVGIPSPAQRMKEYPHQLSGGMRQRVVIAIALSCGPKLLFADEPTTALDVTVQAQILDLLQSLQEERFMSVILVTHDLGVVAGRAHDIAVMYAGKIVEKAPTEELFSNMKMPYTEALLQSIPKLDYPSHTRLAVIPGRPPNLIHTPPGCNFAPRCFYAQERCLTEEPELTTAVPGHEFACFYPVGTDEGAEALARNRTRGHNAGGTPVPMPEKLSA